VTRGQKRRHDPSIPKHIDQKKLPVGCYWNRRDRNWYALAGKPRKRMPLGGPGALMSDLYKAMEALRGIRVDTLDYVLGKYHESKRFRELATTTRDDYEYCRGVLQAHETKLGITFAYLPLTTVTMPLIQRLVDQIAEDFPAKANHVKRYLSAAFTWAMRRGYCSDNPAKGVAEATQKNDHRMPEAETMHAVAKFLRARGEMPSKRKGSVAPYVWAVAEIAYSCITRSVEVRDMTDDRGTPDGLLVKRRKGSLPTLVVWSDELREAWDWLQARRARIWKAKRIPTPLRADQRPLVVSEDGVALTRSALNSAWRRAMGLAIAEGLITDGERFGLHGLKHRGVTDTEGTKQDKKAASGHRTDQMVNLYDHAVAVVQPIRGRVQKPAK
jgi:site-specific recombinase XerC